MPHRPPWYDLSCYSGVKTQYNQQQLKQIAEDILEHISNEK